MRLAWPRFALALASFLVLFAVADDSQRSVASGGGLDALSGGCDTQEVAALRLAVAQLKAALKAAHTKAADVHHGAGPVPHGVFPMLRDMGCTHGPLAAS